MSSGVICHTYADQSRVIFDVERGDLPLTLSQEYLESLAEEVDAHLAALFHGPGGRHAVVVTPFLVGQVGQAYRKVYK